ncbi:beta-ketoacyl-ACP synthase II [Candidatus Aerophobetes bacterium]|nr:beta-ketoacyl-ACP synthase II [Candidatus Aerophobetes bacterium]
MKERRIVVTGIGVVSPIGIGKDSFWEGLKSGRSGVDKITYFDTTNLPVKIAAEVKDFKPENFMDKKIIRRTDRYIQYGIAASKMAVEDANLQLEKEDRENIGVFIGAVQAGGEFGEKQHIIFREKGAHKVSPFLSTIFYTDSCTSHICIELGLKGNSATVSGGCTAGAIAIIYALNEIKNGKTDLMLAGGADATVISLFIAAMSKVNAMSRRNDEPRKASRPFDKKRDGFVVGEGGCVLVLEELNHALKREAHIYGEISGVGITSSAYHMTFPEPSGEQAIRAMRLALRDAKIPPEKVDYINAHGSSTIANDPIETKAIKSVFGPHAYNLAVSSTKSMHGHLMGATGAIEVAASLLAIENNLIPPTINYEYPDPECDLDYVPNQARVSRVNVALSNSFGFGGKNAVIVVQRYP